MVFRVRFIYFTELVSGRVLKVQVPGRILSRSETWYYNFFFNTGDNMTREVNDMKSYCPCK